VRSEVQVFPGPPLDRVRFLFDEMRLSSLGEAFVFWYGAIAQLGERVLCKHEVVGSIPSGSTTLRPSGYAWRSHGAEGRSVPGVALLGEDRLTRPLNNCPRNITSHALSFGTRVRDF
jgi:hypothetical protein